jgi:hypothetical protein
MSGKGAYRKSIFLPFHCLFVTVKRLFLLKNAENQGKSDGH